MIAGQSPWLTNTTWLLDGQSINTSDALESLGIVFSRAGNSKLQTNKRTQQCRSSFYSLSDLGLAYPGLHSDVKAYLWRSVCSPTLLYGYDAIQTSKQDLDHLKSTQGSLVKKALGISNRSHHGRLLDALSINTVDYSINCRSLSTYYNVMCYDSPARDLTTHILSMYLTTGVTIPGTIMSRVVNMGLSPISHAFHKRTLPRHIVPNGVDGVVDSLRSLISHEQFIKPYSEEHTLVKLLTRAF